MNEKPNEGESLPESSGKVSADANPAVSAEPKGWHADEKEHKAQERAHWVQQARTNKTLGISFVALVGAIGSAIVSALSLNAAIKVANEASRQAEAAFADQRPWLRINLTLIRLRFLDNTDAEISYAFDTKNVGRSPARNIRSRIDGSVVNDPFHSGADQKERCDLARKDAENAPSPGAVLFAGENAAEVPGALNIASNGRITVGHDTYPTTGPAPGRFTLKIVGCFDYTLPSREHGQTGFTYTLARNVNGVPTVFSPISGDIKLNEIFFQRDFFSGGYFQ